MAGAGYGRPSRIWKPSEVPALRDKPFEADELDRDRVDFLCGLWKEQDNLWRKRDRQVEENIRMLLGQQWIVWSDMRQRYIDVAETLTDDERKWRHMPVLHRLLQWWILMKARMTENPPVLSWQPGPDARDAALAEVADPIFKYVWRETAAVQMIDRIASWVIPAGRAHTKSVINPNKGDFLSNRGPAVLQLLDPNGDPVGGAENPIQRYVDDVSYGEDFKPRARLVEQEGGDYGYEEHEETPALMQREGMIELELLTCLEVRSNWDNKPWHQKRAHFQKSLLSPEEVYERWGIECDPDTFAADDEGTNIMWRLLHGDGLWGAAEGRSGLGTGVDETRAKGFVTIYEGWWAPSTRYQGMEEMPGPQGSPGGRLMQVTAGGKVLRDGVRTARFKHVSPIRCFDFLNLPGRPQGSSSQEALNGLSRTRNRLQAQINGHATLVGNPIQLVDRNAGIDPELITNRPGTRVEVDRQPNGIPPIEFVAPPQLGRDVYEASTMMKDEFDDIGLIRGQEATPPSRDPSGKLVEELRVNSDRPVGQTLRDHVTEWGRVAEDWMAMLPTIWDQEKIIQVAGEDNIVRTITVTPDMFDGSSISVEPSIESMLPESRGERQLRVERFYDKGFYGLPGSPIAIQKFLDEARFPHMARATRLGGVDRVMAEHNVGKLLKGVPAMQIPLLEPYDFEIHLWVIDLFMKGPDYLKLDVPRQAEFVNHRNNLKMAMLAKMQSDAMAAEYAAAATGVVGPGSPGAGPGGVGAAPAGPGMGAPPSGSPAGELPRTSSAVA